MHSKKVKIKDNYKLKQCDTLKQGNTDLVRAKLFAFI